MALLVDTDLLIDLERGGRAPDVAEPLGDEERAISLITVSELLHGALRATGAQRTQRRAFVEHLLADDGRLTHLSRSVATWRGRST